MQSVLFEHKRQWLKPDGQGYLDKDDVHIWRVDANAYTRHLPHLEGLLSQDERERARQYHADIDRERYIVARALLRIILGKYLEAEPARLRFVYGPNGKPDLVESLMSHRLRFNLSHSNGWTLYAITYDREIGVDIEHIRPGVDVLGIAKRWFSRNEHVALHALPSPLHVQAFYTAWTRKEAYLKALGQGLAGGLDNFEVSLRPSEPATLNVHAQDPHEVLRWKLEDVPIGRDYAATVAAEGHGWDARLWVGSELCSG